MQPQRVDPLHSRGTLHGIKRARAMAEAAKLSQALAEAEQALSAAAAHYREARRRLGEVQEQLRPKLGRRARQPAPDGSEQLPEVATDATDLWGRRLRSVALTLLRRSGRLTLIQLHALLHRHGYVINADSHVKILADAMGYEVDRGRARRVERGVYEAADEDQPRLGRHGNEALRTA